MMANALSGKNILSKISGNGEWLFEDANIKEDAYQKKNKGGSLQGLPKSPMKRGIDVPTLLG